jgi:alcohol dehydrogenase class IV
MNIAKKLFCRIYQAAFYAALPVLPYREPEIYHSVKEIGPLLKRKKLRSVLLVTDPFLRSSGSTVALETHLKESGIHCAVYDKTCANPTVKNVEEARSLFVKEGCEALIAFGGGSSMDCAKAVGARIAFPKKSMDQLKGLLRVWKKIPPLIAIPTTAGTGSEVTLAAVITDSEKKHKYTMNSFTLIPSYAVLDPAVTYTLPPSLTATTGMDALTHAVEAYIGRSTTKETRARALEAVSLIFQNIETAYQDGSNREARANMLRAAYAAGIAFSKSYVGYVHAVAHSLGGQYNTPHGLANSVLLPIVLKEYGPCVYRKLHELGVAAGVCAHSDSNKGGAEKFIHAIQELNHRMNIPETLSGIRSEDIPMMAKHADSEANPLYPVPRLMNAKELELFYELVSEERAGAEVLQESRMETAS